MAQQKSLYTYSGKLDNTVGFLGRGGKRHVRFFTGKYNDKKSQEQLAARLRFKLLTQAAAAVSGFLRLGFNKSFGSTMSPTNAFVKLSYVGGVTGTYPNLELSPKDLVVSYGSIDNPFSPTANADGEDITVSWSDNSGLGNAEATDKVMLLLYNPAKQQSVYSLAVADRSTRTATLSAPATWAGDQIAVYLAMQRPTTGETSKSVHLGIFTI